MLAALGCGAIAAPGPSAAADPLWSGSYAAAGACHCAGEVHPDVAGREVDTPLGRRSVARVCEALGEGPGLRLENGRWNHTVYPDAQCGHGPFASGVELLDPECAGMRGPNLEDCRPIGPTWDLERAFAPALGDSERGGADAAVAAALAESGAAVEIVQVDGRFWRRAPEGTPTQGGRPGGRIILDDELWLLADDPRFAEADAPDAAAIRWEEAPAASFEPDFGAQKGARPRTASKGTAPAELASADDERDWREAPEASFEPDFGVAEEVRMRTSAATAARAEPASPDLDGRGKAARGTSADPDAVAAAGERAPGARVASEATVTGASPEGGRRWKEAPEASFDPEFAASPGDADAGAPEAVAADAPDTDVAPATLGAALPVDGPVARIDADRTDRAAPAVEGADADGIDASVESSAKSVAATAPGQTTGAASAPVSALRLPVDARGSSDEFGYVEAMPKSYDIGGAGFGLEASGEAAQRFHFLLRGAAAESYQELALGVGVHVTPVQADRLTLALTGGVEYGVFDLTGTDAQGNPIRNVTDDDVGGFVALSGRLVLNSRFELTGGVGYSGFHEGDPHGFGGAFFHVNRRLDLMSRFEVGDNDQLGIGLRYYY